MRAGTEYPNLEISIHSDNHSSGFNNIADDEDTACKQDSLSWALAVGILCKKGSIEAICFKYRILAEEARFE